LRARRRRASFARPPEFAMPARIDLGPKPPLGYVDSTLDRLAERRNDVSWLTALAEDPRSGFYAMGGDAIILKKAGAGFEPLFAPGEDRALGTHAEQVFLGLADGAGRFGIGVDRVSVEVLRNHDDYFVTDLRSIAVQGLVEAHHLPAIAEAKALLHWHLRHRFCSNCGLPTRVVEAGWRRDCAGCGGQHFPRTDPVVIMLAVRDERCLLGRSPRFAPTMWSCLAGFIEPGEAIEDAVHRETREEAGISCGRVSYYASQPWPFPSSLMIGCHAEALSDEIVIDRNELEDARWFARGEVADMLMRRHGDGLTAPPPVAIAHHIIRAWVEGEVAFD